jgi:hypothetical protein
MKQQKNKIACWWGGIESAAPVAKVAVTFLVACVQRKAGPLGLP